MNLILTKKRTTLDDILDALMRLSYRKIKQRIRDSRNYRYLETKKDRRIFSSELYISVTFSRTDFLVDHTMVFVTCL